MEYTRDDADDEDYQPATGAIRRVARETDLPEFTRALVNQRLKAAGSYLQLGNRNDELMRDVVGDALLAVANEIWDQIVWAMAEAHPELDIIG